MLDVILKRFPPENTPGPWPGRIDFDVQSTTGDWRFRVQFDEADEMRNERGLIGEALLRALGY